MDAEKLAEIMAKLETLEEKLDDLTAAVRSLTQYLGFDDDDD